MTAQFTPPPEGEGDEGAAPLFFPSPSGGGQGGGTHWCRRDDTVDIGPPPSPPPPGEGEEGRSAIAPLPVWFVAFVETPVPMWWQRLLKPGFRHCLAFAWDHAGARWLVFNPLFDAVILRALDDEGFAGFLADLKARRPHIMLARACLREAEAASLRRRQAGAARVARPRLLMTCASAIAAILGLRLCALTPYALYRTLVRRGAKPIHPEPDHR